MTPQNKRSAVIDDKILEMIRIEVATFTGLYVYPPHTEKTHAQSAHIDELVGAACEAVARSQKNFDPLRGVRFKTYASTVAKHAIWAAAKPRVKDVMADPRRRVSLDKPINDGEGNSAPLMDFIPHEDEGPSFAEGAWSHLRGGLTRWRDYQTLQLKAAGHTNAEIGKILGISEEGARQVVNAAVERAEELAATLPRDFADAFTQAAHSAARSRVIGSRRGFWVHQDNARFQEEWEARGCYPEKNPALFSALDICRLAFDELKELSPQEWARLPIKEKRKRELGRIPLSLPPVKRGFDTFPWRHRFRHKLKSAVRARPPLLGTYNEFLEYMPPAKEPNGNKFQPSAAQSRQTVFQVKARVPVPAIAWPQRGSASFSRQIDMARDRFLFDGKLWRSRGNGVWVSHGPIRRLEAPSIASDGAEFEAPQPDKATAPDHGLSAFPVSGP